ncbi:MAG: hypothetical protein MUD01_00960 [Chloroflexaceae bacterium]|jgi:hypothetical protein|nr:hypothetical protein [Chloroflexaceae bacterium]
MEQTRQAAPATIGVRSDEQVARTTVPGIRVYFACVVVGLLSAVMVGAALSWDGSYVLFSLLNYKEPFIPHNRYIHGVVQFPTLLLSNLTDNTWLLGLMFGLMLALIPLVSLLVCWLLVRRERPELFVWPALGTGLGLLPGQFALVTEAALAIYLTWPIVLCVLMPPRRSHVLVVLGFTVLLLITHPISIALTAMIAAIALLLLVLDRRRLRQLLLYAIGFGTITGVAAYWFQQVRTSYEQEQLSIQRLQEAYTASLAGTAVFALGFVLLAVLLLLVGARLKNQGLSTVLHGAELLCLLLAGLLFLIRGLQPQLWMGSLDLRTWSLFIALPFFGAALLEFVITRRSGPAPAEEQRHRIHTVQLVSLIFCTTLVAQSILWAGLTQRLQGELASRPFGCISMTSLPWVEKTPLNHWSLTSYVYILEGRTPDQMVLGWDNCTTMQIGAKLPVVPWELPPHSGPEWFDMRPLQARLAQEQQPSQGCSVALATGWYWTEQRNQSLWNWSTQSATLRVQAAAAGEATLSANVLSAALPNTLAVLVNGQEVQQLRLDGEEARSAEVRNIMLEPGDNTITLLSTNPAAPTETDSRPLALGFENLTLTQAGAGPCVARP